MKRSLRFTSLTIFLFSLFLFFLPTQLGRHFWPSFTLPYGLRVDYLSPTLYMTDVLVVLLALCVFMDIVITKQWHGRQSRLYLLYVVVALFLLFNCTQARYPLLALYGFVKFLECSFLVWFVATQKTLFVRHKNVFVIILAVSVLLQSLLAILQYLKQGSINGMWYYLGERFFTSLTPGIANTTLFGETVLRPYATFPHPNVLAGFLLVSLVLLGARLSTPSNRQEKILIVSALLAGTVALVVTMSRIPILLWTGVLLFCGWHVRHTSRQKNIAVFSLLVVIGGVALWSSFLDRFLGFSLIESSVIQREQLVKQSVTLIANNPLLGVGLKHFLISLPYSPLTSQLFQPVHNIFLLLTVEVGVIGLSIFVWFLYKTYRVVIQQQRPERLLKLLLVSLVLSIGFFDHYFLTLQQGLFIFSLILGYCWQQPATIEKHDSRIHRRRKPR